KARGRKTCQCRSSRSVRRPASRRPKMGGDISAELRRHLRAHPKPALEARRRLVKQRAEAIDNAVSPRLGGGKERGLKRAIDDVGYGRVLGKRGKVEVERRLSRHAEARSVHQQPAAGKRLVPVLPGNHRDAGTEALRQGPS